MSPVRSSAVSSPTARYRCTACGNLTRFDVLMTRRTRSFHHYTVGGELSVEDEEVLEEVVEAVDCRWCGSGASVEILEGDPA
jgi:predicted nucleic acid-binding Zn ribbon protein